MNAYQLVDRVLLVYMWSLDDAYRDSIDRAASPPKLKNMWTQRSQIILLPRTTVRTSFLQHSRLQLLSLLKAELHHQNWSGAGKPLLCQHAIFKCDHDAVSGGFRILIFGHSFKSGSVWFSAFAASAVGASHIQDVTLGLSLQFHKPNSRVAREHDSRSISALGVSYLNSGS